MAERLRSFFIFCQALSQLPPQLAKFQYWGAENTVTPGNVNDTTPVISLVRGLTGKLFGYKGYIGKKLADTLPRQDLALMTKVRKNMKSLPMTLVDKALLKARNMAEAIIGHIKAFSSLNLPRDRSPVKALIHLIAALTAYQLNPLQPYDSPALQPS